MLLASVSCDGVTLVAVSLSCKSPRRAQLDTQWMPASPNILFFFELLTGETGKSWDVFFSFYRYRVTHTKTQAWLRGAAWLSEVQEQI